MKAEELHEKTLAELKEEEAKLKKELFDLRFKLGTRQLLDTAALTRTKRDIARVMTALTQKAAAASESKSAGDEVRSGS